MWSKHAVYRCSYQAFFARKKSHAKIHRLRRWIFTLIPLSDATDHAEENTSTNAELFVGIGLLIRMNFYPYKSSRFFVSIKECSTITYHL